MMSNGELHYYNVLNVQGAIAFLQHIGFNVHIGGKSVLALSGFLHYLRDERAAVSLYGETRDLPAWFCERFPFYLVNEDLFDEPSGTGEKLCVSRLDGDPNKPFVSSPERAVLELLAVVPKRETMGEAELIMEGLFGLRVKEMRIIFTACKKSEIKKLFARKARKLGLPIASNIRSFYANPDRL